MSRGRSQKKSQNDITCWNCQKKVHFKNQCRVPRKHNNKKKYNDDQSANATIDEIEDVLLCSLDSSSDS